jgi:hypothetical protein
VTSRAGKLVVATEIRRAARFLGALFGAGAVIALLAPSAAAFDRPPTQNGTCVETDGDVFEPEVLRELPGGGERIRYRCGPIDVTPGQNRIETPVMLRGLHRPDENGYIARLKPDLVEANGEALDSDLVMFHHAVWLNQDRPDDSAPAELSGRFPQRFFGAGEEKTTLDLPDGYGYDYTASDRWAVNHMLHSLVSQTFELYIEYTLDFYPDGSDAANEMTPARALWLDVYNGSGYPVFDVKMPTSSQPGSFNFRGQEYATRGSRDGTLEFPTDATVDPYEGSPFAEPLNQWIVDRPGYLLWTAGHVHSGGLWTDLNLIRDGARYGGPKCGAKAQRAGKAKKALARVNRKIARAKRNGASRARLVRLGKQRIRMIAAKTRTADDLRTCRNRQPEVDGSQVRLFRSNARYFDRPGRKGTPTSWDMGMFNTTSDWKPQVRPGDTLEVTTTYETKRGSWYESMGINFLFMADCNPDDPDQTCGQNPYRVRQDLRKELNHGPLPENANHGGQVIQGAPDPRKLQATEVDPERPLLIGNWTYESSDFFRNEVLAVRQGERVTFELADGDVDEEIWHSITSCEAPCNRSTGISYPLPDGRFRFDSGQLGTREGSPAAGPINPSLTNGTVGRLDWDTPDDMPTGTYTFYCRIHPSMRGAIKVLPRD